MVPDTSRSRKLVSEIRFCTILLAALAKQTVMSRRPDRAFPTPPGLSRFLRGRRPRARGRTCPPPADHAAETVAAGVLHARGR
jgi:hypothetical protein